MCIALPSARCYNGGTTPSLKDAVVKLTGPLSPGLGTANDDSFALWPAEGVPKFDPRAGGY